MAIYSSLIQISLVIVYQNVGTLSAKISIFRLEFGIWYLSFVFDFRVTFRGNDKDGATH